RPVSPPPRPPRAFLHPPPAPRPFGPPPQAPLDFRPSRPARPQPPPPHRIPHRLPPAPESVRPVVRRPPPRDPDDSRASFRQLVALFLGGRRRTPDETRAARLRAGIPVLRPDAVGEEAYPRGDRRTRPD